VAWYGRLVGNAMPETPRQPVDLGGDLLAPVLGLYGGADQGIPQESVEKMKAAVKRAQVKVEFMVYPDAPHAFHADYRPSFREGPAKDGWNKALAWFKEHGL
jgi:carboxymethylenebutenolidase